MSIQRLKSLVIVILLLINLFFLADIVWDRVVSASERSRTIESLQATLASAGIIFSENAVNDISALEAYVTSPDAFADAVIARSILGDCEPGVSDSGQLYTSSRGTAFFNTSGIFTIELTERYVPSGVSTERSVKKLLRNMSIDTDEPRITSFGETDIVTAFCTMRGFKIFNCTVTFEFKGGALQRVMGRKPTGISTSEHHSQINFSTAMLSFLRHEQGNSPATTVIDSIDSGYRMNVSAFGDGTLTPGWLISTDTGAFFLDASTGEILRNDA